MGAKPLDSARHDETRCVLFCPPPSSPSRHFHGCSTLFIGLLLRSLSLSLTCFLGFHDSPLLPLLPSFQLAVVDLTACALQAPISKQTRASVQLLNTAVSLCARPNASAVVLSRSHKLYSSLGTLPLTSTHVEMVGCLCVCVCVSVCLYFAHLTSCASIMLS